MLDGFKNRLRAIFGMKAKPPAPEIPAEILDNKFVRKAVLKKHRRARLKKIAVAFAAAAALSTGTQYFPDTVSQPLDKFMAEKGYGTDFARHFHSKEIRVYDRFNPLYPFHLAGNSTVINWHEGLQISPLAAIPLAIATPFDYAGSLWKGFTDMIPGNKLDAFSISNDDAPDTRTNFIRPPDDFSLNRFMSDFTRIDGQKLEFASDRVELQRVLFQFVMLHESRHGDQDKQAFGAANESDADLYAFRVMKARGTNPALLNEAATIVAHARAISGTVGGDYGHASTFTLMRGGQRIFDAHQDAAAYERLHDVLAEASAHNRAAFPDTMPRGNRYLYITLAMQQAGLLDEDPGMKKAAVSFVGALGYFDRASGGKLIDPNFDLDKIKLEYLTQPYKPVPDKLTPPPRPNS